MNRTRFLSLFIVALMFICLAWAALAPAQSQPSSRMVPPTSVAPPPPVSRLAQPTTVAPPETSRLAAPTTVAPEPPLGAAGQVGN
jgi:hypothetical protein